MTAQLLATVPPMLDPRADLAARRGERGARLGVALQVADPLTAAGLRRWLRRGEDVAPAEGSAADVIVVAPDPMPEAWLRRAVAAGRASAPGARVVVIVDGVVVDGPAPLSAEALDADVLVTRAELSEENFLAAVRAGAAGDGVDDLAAPAATDGPADQRAATVLGMLADGHDLAEIASALFYSERTVKNVLYSYLGEIGARNRVHAVACAIRAGLV